MLEKIPARYQVTIVVALVATGYATGRYTVPVKVVTETKVVEIEKKTTDQDKNVHTKTVVVEVKKPDGTDTTTTTTSQDDDTKTDTVVAKTDSSDVKKETDKESGFLLLSALGGVNVLNGTPVYGAKIDKSILGPVTVGLWGLNNGTVGASVGLKF